MSVIPEESWLFTRGPQSVRLLRVEHANGCTLIVKGPETETMTHQFAHVAECMKRQAEIEQNLLASGFQLAQTSSDRRKLDRMWRGADHRRAAS